MPRKAKEGGASKKPKGPRRPYTYFLQEERKNYGKGEFVLADFSRACSDRWKTLSDDEKAPYNKMAEADKARYSEEMANYSPPEGEEDEEKKTKGKKRKRDKDPNQPKRNKSAYIFFANDQRPNLQQEFPGETIGTISKRLGEIWSKINSIDKSKYDAMAKKDKERYEQEMQAFRQGNFVDAKTSTVQSASESEE